MRKGVIGQRDARRRKRWKMRVVKMTMMMIRSRYRAVWHSRGFKR
jgi:hypothetical protein